MELKNNNSYEKLYVMITVVRSHFKLDLDSTKLPNKVEREISMNIYYHLIKLLICMTLTT